MSEMSSTSSPYARFADAELILRDELAIDRTLLANERTLLAYLRSSISLLIAGVSIIHFSKDSLWFQLVGFFCLPIGIWVGVFGTLRYQKMGRGIGLVRNKMRTIAKQSAPDNASI